MTGRSQIWDGAQWVELSNNPGSVGPVGPPGDGGGVSQDAGNQAVLGSDSLVYVPDFADGVYLKLTGGTVSGDTRISTNLAVGGVFPEDLWSSGVVTMGSDGLIGSMGSFRLDVASNWVRTPTGFVGLNVNGQDGASSVTVDPTGEVRLLADNVYDGPGTGGPPTLRLSLTEDRLQVLVQIQNTTDGTSFAPDYSFIGDTATGFYHFGAGMMAMSNDTVRSYTFAESGFNAIPVYTRTTGVPVNVAVSANGIMERNTSALKYKDDVTDAAYLKDIDLLPVKFHRNDDDRYFYGMVADPIAAQDTLLGVYQDQKEQVAQVTEHGEDYFIDGAWTAKGEWELENYDINALIAVIAAKINDQEERLAALESP